MSASTDVPAGAKRRRSCAAAGGDRWWSTLLPELLLPILRRLLSVRDRIRFGCVCSRWRSVLTEARHLLPPTAPLLLLPYAGEDDHQLYPRRRQVLHGGIPDDWVHRILLPESKKAICGSSMGWLLVSDGGGEYVHLWNPITKEEIPLPRPPPCNFSCGYNSSSSSCEDKVSCKDKVVLSSNPSSSSSSRCCTVMAIRKCSRASSFCRIGDDDMSWTTFEETGILEDVICYRGQFYGVTWGGGVVVLDVNGPSPKTAVAAVDSDWYQYPTDDDDDDVEYCSYHNYLVESSGELLRVTSFVNIDEHSKMIIKFVVHKLDFDTKTWSKVVSLQGDQALFLGSSSSVSVSVAAATDTDHGYKRNCIYFLGTCYDFYCLGGDMGVFDLEDGSVTTFGIDKYTCSSKEDCSSLFLYSPEFWIDLAPW